MLWQMDMEAAFLSNSDNDMTFPQADVGVPFHSCNLTLQEQHNKIHEEGFGATGWTWKTGVDIATFWVQVILVRKFPWTKCSDTFLCVGRQARNAGYKCFK